MYFFLLEMASISLSELEFLASFKLPAPTGVLTHARSSPVWLVVVILILAWPAQFIGPLASGAVTWIPDYTFDRQKQTTLPPIIGEATFGDWWNWYLEFPNTRKARSPLASLISSHTLSPQTVLCLRREDQLWLFAIKTMVRASRI